MNDPNKAKRRVHFWRWTLVAAALVIAAVLALTYLHRPPGVYTAF